MQRLVAHVAQQSYSIFLAHFAVSLVVSAWWFDVGWQSPWGNLLGMAVSFTLSLAAGALLYRQVESQSPTWQRWASWLAVFAFSGAAVMAWDQIKPLP